jgi:hypothetical protein
MNDPPALMVEARRALLDALVALADHGESLVLVGAQAVHLRTATANLSFSVSYTTDADLVINPAELGAVPLLAEAMQGTVVMSTQTSQETSSFGLIKAETHNIVSVQFSAPAECVTAITQGDGPTRTVHGRYRCPGLLL